MKAIKNAIRKSLQQAGLKLVRAGMPVRSMDEFLSYARGRGFVPASVIDVGVGYGTWELYNSFPQAMFHLVEPVADFGPAIERIKSAVKAEWHGFAAGAGESELEIDVVVGDLQRTSFQSRTDLTRVENKIEKRTIPVRPLDIFADLPGPVLLKIDTEGYEMAALSGAQRLLPRCEIVILEASIAERFVGGYRFIDLLRFMDESGFDLIDICHIVQDAGGPMKMIDAVFARRGSLLGLAART